MNALVPTESPLRDQITVRFEETVQFVRSIKSARKASLTHSELVALLDGIKGTAIVGLTALTDAKARKTGNPFGQIFKQVRAVGFVGAEYGKAVNREAKRQGTTQSFVANSLPWGTWLVPFKVITHNGEYYLRTQTTPGQRRKVAAKVLCYRDARGMYLPRETVKPFLPIAKESTRQQTETGIEETVWVRTYAFKSLQSVRIAGRTYNIKP